MQRRKFILGSLMSGVFTIPHLARGMTVNFRADSTVAILQKSIDQGLIRSAVMLVREQDRIIEHAFGSAQLNSAFLLGSISKPICIAACMSLYDQGLFKLDDPVSQYIPEFRGDNRESVKISHLLTHVSGLPDQVPDNASLRKNHATLAQFVEATLKVPLHFAPGSKYEYSSMGILLATEIARRISGEEVLGFVDRHVFRKLQMNDSAIGLGKLPPNQIVAMQTEHAAPEAGGGDPSAKDWDWNSPYWRALGAPWGGVHSTARDLLKFLDAFVEYPNGFLKPETAKLMIRNHNQGLLVPRGLGFGLGPIGFGSGCSEQTFGHTGSTGTIAWLDPANKRTCIVLTSLPAKAVTPHPRDLVSSEFCRQTP